MIEVGPGLQKSGMEINFERRTYNIDIRRHSKLGTDLFSYIHEAAWMYLVKVCLTRNDSLYGITEYRAEADYIYAIKWNTETTAGMRWNRK